ncbi:Protein YghO [Commensalibacter sp. Nvir]|uniref:hypothetical protein n=1 Tax=Commensalibacter sp. Nvir TaxID=3069817 RepID=UPI002D71523C|nr:Protein YghO [Commensalibacter sp. Nvir]
MTLDSPQAEHVTIKSVTSHKQLSIFIRLPRLLYHQCPEYVPPLDYQSKELLHPKKSPFFRYGIVHYFLACKSNQVVGRISAHIDPTALRQWKKPIGFFGALDTINDPIVVKKLIDAACEWLKKRGMEKIRGPYVLSTNSEIGTMIEGQSSIPMIGMPWHPKWISEHIEKVGLTKAMDLVSYQMKLTNKVKKLHKVPSTIPLTRKNSENITIRKWDKKHTIRDGEIVRQLYNDAWQDNWGFVPITPIEMTHLVKDLKTMLKPDDYVLIEYNKIPVAVALIVPNLYDIIKFTGPTPSPLGWLKIITKLKCHQFKSARVILLGISQSIRNTAMGALMPSLIISELFNRGENLPYKMVELGWILETNKGMRHLIERIAPEPCKVHRIYEKNI